MGIGTKWITSHSRLLTLLVSPDSGSAGAAEPLAIIAASLDSRLTASAEAMADADTQTAEQIATLNALGLRPRPAYMRVALLDPPDRARFAGIRDLAVSSEQLARLAVWPRHLIMTADYSCGPSDTSAWPV